MCGIVGIIMKPHAWAHTTRAPDLAVQALQRLQHRGHEGAGLVVFDDTLADPIFRKRHGVGLVSKVLRAKKRKKLLGGMALATNRYSTAGDKNDPNPKRNIGPLMADTRLETVAVVHNGNLKGAIVLRRELQAEGALLQTGTDTEVLLHFLARSKKETFQERLLDALEHIPVAYSFVIMTERGLWAVRDPLGVRPLILGSHADFWVFASESTALDAIGVGCSREVEPGEVVFIPTGGEPRSFRFAQRRPARPCIFEWHYFARPDSARVESARREAGKMLARNHPVTPRSDAEVIVVGVPDSGLLAANGYAREAGLPLELALVRAHEGRTFMHPTQEERHAALRLKHSPIKHLLAGKVVVLVDDSIVRGNTFKRIVELVRGAGALEVHGRIATPKIVHPCHYGIDTPTFEELLAYRYPNEERMAQELGLDSLAFLDLPEFTAVTSAVTGAESFCATCFSGELLPTV